MGTTDPGNSVSGYTKNCRVMPVFRRAQPVHEHAAMIKSAGRAERAQCGLVAFEPNDAQARKVGAGHQLLEDGCTE